MNERRHSIDIMFIIILIGLFAITSVGMALLGVNVYKNTTTTDNEDLNTAALYFTQKVHQCENKNMIRIASLDGENPSLVIGSYEDGTEVETWLFVKDNNLLETTIIKGSDVDPEFGQKVIAMKSVYFKQVNKKLLQITLTSPEGETDTINLALIGGGSNK